MAEEISPLAKVTFFFQKNISNDGLILTKNEKKKNGKQSARLDVAIVRYSVNNVNNVNNVSKVNKSIKKSRNASGGQLQVSCDSVHNGGDAS